MQRRFACEGWTLTFSFQVFMPLDRPSSSDAPDITSCDREPIRIPGSIQPHGILFALSLGSNIVSQLSGNAGAFLTCPVEQAPGQAFASFAIEEVSALLVASDLSALRDGPLMLAL
jgi:chemotaxis family two-component system sensor kinase Cph1